MVYTRRYCHPLRIAYDLDLTPVIASQGKKRNNSKLTVLTLLRGQFSRVLRKKAVRHEADVEADAGVGVEEAVVVGAVVAVEVVAEVAVARKASPLQCLRNKAEKSANGLLSLTVALILVFVVRLSPLLRHQKKQKQMLHDICTAIKLCVSCVQFVLWGIAFCLERRRLL